MKTKAGIPAVATGVLITAALTTGSPVFLFAALIMFQMILFGLLSVLWASATMEWSVSAPRQNVRRGEEISLELTLRHRGLIPIAPVRLMLEGANHGEDSEIRLKDAPGKTQKLNMIFRAVHVGVFRPGIKEAVVEDLFGIWQKNVSPQAARCEILVYPQLMDIEEMRFAPGDSGSDVMARATEDINNPSEIRGYQPGDAMKKIHWKLSLRKGELMVRKFEEPVLPEALILMDCSAPPDWGFPDVGEDLRDTLLETAASVMVSLTRSEHNARLPLMGNHPVECTRDMSEPVIMENLARHDFSESDRFERVLMLETRRMRKVGATVVIAARLNGAMVDMMTRMRRMGPYVRFYLAVIDETDSRITPLVSRLQQGDVEVRFVRPERIE